MNDQLINPYAFLIKMRPEKHVRYPYTDLGDGRLLADCYQDAIKFVPERKCWYCYRDGVWVQDLGGLRIMEYCKEFADALKAYAKAIEDEDLRTSYTKHVKKWQGRKARETIIKDASHRHQRSNQHMLPYIHTSNGYSQSWCFFEFLLGALLSFCVGRPNPSYVCLLSSQLRMPYCPPLLRNVL